MKKRGGERLLTGGFSIAVEGTQTSTNGGEGKRVKKCRKCDGPKPEVSQGCVGFRSS
jgi:hypothetical protein